jgi:hypothetical protein
MDARRRVVALAIAAALVVAAVALVPRGPSERIGVASGSLFGRVVLAQPLPRDADAYAGQGAWVDAFDYAPAYQAAGRMPSITPAAVDDMADHGVRTLFLQAARADGRTPGPLVDPGLIAAFLVRAHRRGMRVVGWYLPTFADVQRDAGRLLAIRDFNVLGHRFDGLAVDIEDNRDVPDPAARSARLVELSLIVRDAVGTDALGAIVLPPVQTEVVNPAYWPAFPWRDIAAAYDVWLPMSYWTFRDPVSGYHDGYTYNEESVRRLRANLGRPDAPVHAIGGIGDLLTADELTRFVQSLVDTSAVGGSIYDWSTLPAAARDQLAASFASGAGAALTPPP